MDDQYRYTLLRLALIRQMDELSGDGLLQWLEHVSGDLVFTCTQDLIASFVFSECADSILSLQSCGGTTDELRLEIDCDEAVVRSVSCGVELLRKELPDWIQHLDGAIQLMRDTYERPIYAAELRDLLISLWYRHLC